eukprot:scaffold339040_cov37-Prasinocladus_malaysianus.AAC.1
MAGRSSRAGGKGFASGTRTSIVYDVAVPRPKLGVMCKQAENRLVLALIQIIALRETKAGTGSSFYYTKQQN